MGAGGQLQEQGSDGGLRRRDGDGAGGLGSGLRLQLQVRVCVVQDSEWVSTPAVAGVQSPAGPASRPVPASLSRRAAVPVCPQRSVPVLAHLGAQSVFADSAAFC